LKHLAVPPKKSASSKPSTPEPTEAQASDAPLSFEASLKRLGEIVERLESGELPLEESLALFEQGVRLSRDAQARLDKAEKRVEQLLGFDEQGRPLVEPLDTD
jgi:exodeoxyribonuclease VII small subunit